MNAQQDRRVAAQNLADTEFLTREIASLRLGLNEVATRDFIRSELRALTEELAAHAQQVRELENRIAELEKERE